MRIEIDGINIHHKFKVSIKKPFGGKSSFVSNVYKHPGATITGATLLGPTGAIMGAGLDNANTNSTNKINDLNSQMNRDPGGLSDEDMINQKYGQLASDFGNAAIPLRQQLANSLSSSGSELFKKTNPYLLQDLNSRGLFTSPSAVNQSQSAALGEIAAQDRSTLNDFDTDIFGQIQNLKATGVTTGLQRSLDLADQKRQEGMAKYLAKVQGRNQLINSVIGLGGQLGAAALTHGYGGSGNRQRSSYTSDSQYDPYGYA